MNYNFFDITINATKTRDEVRTMIDSLLKDTFNPYEIASSKAFDSNMDKYFNQMNDGKETVIYDIETTTNSIWRYEIIFSYYPENAGKYGIYPDFKLAELFHSNFNWNCICSRNDIFKDIDDNKPYWGICLVNNKWYLCDYYHFVDDSSTSNVIEIAYELGKIGYEFDKKIFSLEQLRQKPAINIF